MWTSERILAQQILYHSFVWCQLKSNLSQHIPQKNVCVLMLVWNYKPISGELLWLSKVAWICVTRFTTSSNPGGTGSPGASLGISTATVSSCAHTKLVYKHYFSIIYYCYLSNITPPTLTIQNITLKWRQFWWLHSKEYAFLIKDLCWLFNQNDFCYMPVFQAHSPFCITDCQICFFYSTAKWIINFLHKTQNTVQTQKLVTIAENVNQPTVSA